VLVALNFADEPRAVATGPGLLRLATTRRREGERVGGTLELAPVEGAILWLDPPP
jgi:hypothetical protein